MAFLASFISNAVEFIVYLAVIVAACVCGAKFKDYRTAKKNQE